jgi:hypothetical protein
MSSLECCRKSWASLDVILRSQLFFDIPFFAQCSVLFLLSNYIKGVVWTYAELVGSNRCVKDRKVTEICLDRS